MKQYGLIGYPLSHSFSPGYFNEKFHKLNINAKYDAFPIDSIENFLNLIKENKFEGLNVTIPYKKSVMPYLDLISDEAGEIGAVNTIKFKDGKLIGYNTDVYGFEQSLLTWVKDIKNIKGALVLGNGGAAKAVIYALDKLEIPFKIVSRTGVFTYETVNQDIVESYNLWINTTPLGMYPDILSKLSLPYDLINHDHYLYDLVYNPELTAFLKEGQIKKAQVKNGYEMLLLQAEKSWEIWNQ